MGGKNISFEELMGKTGGQGETNAGGGAPASPKKAGTVSFEELMGRGHSRPKKGAAGGQPIAQAPENVFGEEAVRIHKGSAAPPEIPRFGLNFLHTYWEYWSVGTVLPATKYGGGAAPYADAGEIGATIARQVGLRDLMWARLAYDPTSWHSLQTGQLVSVNVAAQLAAVRRDGSNLYNHEWLAEALAEAHAAGVKVLLTFGAMGAESVTGLYPARSPTSAGEWEETVVARDGHTYALNQQYVYAMDWSEGHMGQSIDGHDFPAPALSPTMPRPGPEDQWHLQSLDVSSGYKRGYLRQMAVAVGSMLGQVDSDLRAISGISFTDVVEGIELFNEVEHGNQYVRNVTASSVGADEYPDAHPRRPGLKVRYVQIAEPWESSYRWGRACFQAAYGLRTTLDALADGDDVKIRLPGICSYSDGLNDTWEDRLESLRGLATGFVDEAVGYLSDRRYGPGWSDTEILPSSPASSRASTITGTTPTCSTTRATFSTSATWSARWPRSSGRSWRRSTTSGATSPIRQISLVIFWNPSLSA